jgi:hypothetical protein
LISLVTLLTEPNKILSLTTPDKLI